MREALGRLASDVSFMVIVATVLWLAFDWELTRKPPTEFQRGMFAGMWTATVLMLAGDAVARFVLAFFTSNATRDHSHR
jgi:hypothetical protein